jgi:hypothetical protein
MKAIERAAARQIERAQGRNIIELRVGDPKGEVFLDRKTLIFDSHAKPVRAMLVIHS